MPHHWYPEGYTDPMTPPKMPVWTNTFKSYHDLPSAPNGSNSPSATGSTGQPLSARGPVTGHGLGSASRPPIAHGQAPGVNYRRAPNTVSSGVGPQGIYSGSSVPYNASAPQRLLRADLIRHPSTLGSGSTNTGELAMYEPPPWDGVSQFIHGSTYFKIGDPVYVRRWFTDDKVHSVWLLGKVVRPDFCKDREGREERRYVVSYWDPRTESQKEKTYSPSLKEIIPVDIDMPTTFAVPVARSGASSANINKQTGSHGNSTVFALLPDTNGQPVWTPSVCLGVDPGGYRVRAIAGPSKNQEFSKVVDIMAYNAETARTLRMSGHNVEKSEFDVRR